MVTRLGRLVPAIAPVAVGIVVFAAARLALMPGLGYWDTAEYQAVGPLLGTAHPTGFPTWVILAWIASIVLQPFGDPAFRMNLLAAICLGAAAGTTVILARTLTRSTALGVLAGLGLGLAPAAWAIGTHAETHALHLAIAAALLCLLVGWEDRARDPDPERQARADRWLVAAAFVFGLAMGNHSLTLLLAPPIALFVFAVEPAHPPPPQPGRHVRRGPRRHRRRPVPGAAAAGRTVPGAARVRPPGDLGRVLVRRPRRAVPGQHQRSLRQHRWQGAGAHHPGDRPVRPAHDAHP